MHTYFFYHEKKTELGICEKVGAYSRFDADELR